MFVDASAIVAILEYELGSEILAEALERAGSPITSAVAVFESVLAIRRKRRVDVAKAETAVADFLSATRIRIVALTSEEASAALAAFARYGKGQGHRAQLNLGDCFAYAAATTHATSLLFAGDDFTHTDIPPGSAATA